LFVSAHWDDLSLPAVFIGPLTSRNVHVAGHSPQRDFHVASRCMALNSFAGAGIFLSGQIFNLQEHCRWRHALGARSMLDGGCAAIGFKSA